MSKAEDLLWISRVVVADDHRAFERLVCKYQSSVRRFLLNLTLGDAYLADDLAQETFIKVYLNIRSFKGISAFSTWLYRIAYNVFFDAKRAYRHTETLETINIDKESSSNLDFLTEKHDIYVALKLLRSEERVAVLLCYMEGRTHKEAAGIMNLPLGTVKTHILNAKSKMRKLLEQQGYGK